MEKLKFNPNNEKYYSADFIKGFECGVERQFNADKAEQKTGRWIYESLLWECSECGYQRDSRDNEGIPIPDNFCANCGAKMKGETE